MSIVLPGQKTADETTKAGLEGIWAEIELRQERIHLTQGRIARLQEEFASLQIESDRMRERINQAIKQLKETH